MREATKNTSDRQPLVSVVIDSYNYGRFIAAAIDSALAQTYKNIEIIVIDDGSTDDSRAIIESYGDKIVGIFKQNAGQASTINRGFQAARGEMIYFLDCDDVAYPDCIQKIVDLYAAQRDETVTFQFRLHIIDKDGEKTAGIMPDIDKLQGDEARELLVGKGFYVFPPTSGNVFSRSVLQKIMPIPEAEYRICADIYLCTMAGLIGTIIDTNEICGQFRIHGSNSGASVDVRAAPRVEDYVEMMIYEADARKKSKAICEKFLNQPIGGNSELRYVIFDSTRRKLERGAGGENGAASRFGMLKKSLNELRSELQSAPSRKKIPVMIYLAVIAFLPKSLVSRLVQITFIAPPKPLGSLVKKAFSS